ncbi:MULTISPECIES: hypothetical protein [Paraburkholderia]|uniref:Uncharacterized protein n=1 Tax=Paraburkholderia madseniana TaxID=2599607 RepID=A0AAP5BMT9_9BURK|nr:MULTISPECIES: hypothetical protein [Paraburkholderia]MCX4151676.1 hypothetical protein [Paraburkholderia madseniana]MCX4176951.1 hypothetical protein [Paraburkholderia madseniana]MDN7154604.1 hypothetical protein [Paraburkholderia sp. WS6]MDQ6413487.1 hypothetical protein [Paraburkholderia madseniana]MDQ6464941.1 hypothetical protein [Paraburkholderia madseniana]
MANRGSVMIAEITVSIRGDGRYRLVCRRGMRCCCAGIRRDPHLAEEQRDEQRYDSKRTLGAAAHESGQASRWGRVNAPGTPANHRVGHANSLAAGPAIRSPDCTVVAFIVIALCIIFISWGGMIAVILAIRIALEEGNAD